MKSIAEKAKELGCDKETVRRKCAKCELPCKKVGSTFVVFEPGEVVTTAGLGGLHFVTSNKDACQFLRIKALCVSCHEDLDAQR